MIIRTKIVATVGPASNTRPMLAELARAGVDVFRVNFSHGDETQRAQMLQDIRAVEQAHGAPLAVMADLCGPKIRVGTLRGGAVELVAGQSLVIQRQPVEGTAERISTTLAELVDSVEPGEPLLLDDGRIRLRVSQLAPPDEVICTVVQGGTLRDGKGINLPGTNLRLSALTEKDRQDAVWIARRDFDYVALSFVRSADDVDELRTLLASAGCRAHIVAKIEKPQALDHIEAIIERSDAIMVARGDLGVEMELPSVPVAQKRIANLCQQAGTPCIIATQMLETMTDAPQPTRAEVSDVANAVLDHADAVMLSGETAVGKYPVAAVRMMNDISQHIQAFHDETAVATVQTVLPDRSEAALGEAVRAIIAADEVAAVAVFTASGKTARVLAKSRLPVPVLALSQELTAVRRMCLYFGVWARQVPVPEHTRDVLALASQFAIDRGVARPGQKLVVLSGRPIGVTGRTNTLVVHTIE